MQSTSEHRLTVYDDDRRIFILLFSLSSLTLVWQTFSISPTLPSVQINIQPVTSLPQAINSLLRTSQDLNCRTQLDGPERAGFLQL